MSERDEEVQKQMLEASSIMGFAADKISPAAFLTAASFILIAQGESAEEIVALVRDTCAAARESEAPL